MKSPDEIREAVDNIPPMEEPPPWEASASPDDVAVASAEDHRRERLKPILMADLKNFPQREPLIKGFLGKGEFSVFFGPPGSGKSFLIKSTALSIARGVDWYGRKVCQGMVVYIATEGSGSICKRTTAYCQHHGVEPEDIPFAVIPTTVDLCTNGADTEAIISEIKVLEKSRDLSCVMIVVDTLARALAGGDENSSKDMGTFIKNVDRLREKTNAHVAVVHHTPKNEKSTPRGHSSLLGAVDVAIKVEKHQNGNSATIEKNKDDEGDWSVGFELEQVVVGQDDDGDNITSCVVIETDVPPKARNRLTGDKATVMEALHDVLCRNDAVVITSYHGIPDNTKCASFEAWRKEFYARASDKPSQEAKRQAFSRNSKALRDASFCAFRDDLVWIVKP